MQKIKNMKRTILIFSVMMGLHAGTTAQYSQYYYHRTGDTIYQDSPIYYHAWWEWEDYRARQDVAVPYPNQGQLNGTANITLTYFHTADTLKVVGIGGIPLFNDVHDTLYLYDFDTAGIFTQRSHIARDSGIDAHRYIKISGNGWWPDRTNTYTYAEQQTIGSCCAWLPWDTLLPVFEYYFDSAVYVVDSFYVGGAKGKCRGALRVGFHWPCDETPYSSECVFPYQPYMYSNNRVSWFYKECPIALLVWPIIQVDTTVPPPDVCVPLTNLQTYDVDTFGLTIAWDTFPQYTAVEICYGTADSLWGCITVRDTNAAALHLPDPAQADYIILARAVCDSLKHDSPWSDTLHITLPRAPLACPPVEGFAVAAVDTFAAILHWDLQPGAMAYELALFHSGTALLDTLPASAAGHHLLSLPDTAVADYAVALRSLCDTATHEAASPWSDTLRFTLPRGSDGIAPALAGRILLLPNPASGQVQITAPCGLLQVDLHNASGTLVLSSPASGTTHTLPLDGLAAGSYIATVRTSCGTAAKRLAIR